MSGQMHFVAAAYAVALVAVGTLLLASWLAMRRAERRAAELRARRR